MNCGMAAMTKVKRGWALLVLGWVTASECFALALGDRNTFWPFFKSFAILTMKMCVSMLITVILSCQERYQVLKWQNFAQSQLIN